jgi:hypothetical protein
MENREKTPEQKAAEKLIRAQVMGNAIGHFSMKLGVIKNDTPIEEQLKQLSDYHNVPSIEEIKGEENKMDSYRQEFMEHLYDKYFSDFPEMLERLGEKKTDNNMANFYALRVMAFLYSSSEEDSEKRKDCIEAYYKLLPQYQDFLTKYIVDNQKWDLTINSKDAFLAYNDVCNLHKDVLKKYPNAGTQITLLIKEVRNSLFEKVAHLKEVGLDDETYKTVVTNVVIGKYTALKFILNKMAEGGTGALGLYSNMIFKEYSLKDVYLSACEVQDKFSLDEDQKKQMLDVKKMLEFLQGKGVDSSSSSGSGCMVALLFLIIPVSIFFYLI